MPMASSVHWYGHVLVREDGHFLRRALDFEVKGRKRGRKRMWTKQVEEESVKVGLNGEGALSQSQWADGVNQIIMTSSPTQTYY